MISLVGPITTNVDISTVIKKHDGKGAGTYWYINNDEKDKASRITSKDMNTIDDVVGKLITKGVMDRATALTMTLWTNKETFRKDAIAAGITDEEAYTYIQEMRQNKASSPRPVVPEVLDRLVALLSIMYGNRTPEKMQSHGLPELCITYKQPVIEKLTELLANNGRDENGFIRLAPAENDGFEPGKGADEGDFASEAIMAPSNEPDIPWD